MRMQKRTRIKIKKETSMKTRIKENDKRIKLRRRTTTQIKTRIKKENEKLESGRE